MKHFVDKGTTLLVDGPASVRILSGKVSVLGAPLKISEKLIVREGKRLPLWVRKRATLELMMGEGASINKVDAATIHSSWDNAAKDILSLDKPLTVMVIGSMDSGKSSFCTFLVNEAMRKKWRTSVIDADLGQSDVGAPLTVGFNFVVKPVKDLFEIDAQDAVFVGTMNPSGAINKVIEGVIHLKDKVIGAGVDFLVINTDGWVDGEDAISYKLRLVENYSPNTVFLIEKKHELTFLSKILKKYKQFTVESSSAIKHRNKEERRSLRELGYAKYLSKSKIRSIPLGWLEIREDMIFGLRNNRKSIIQKSKINEILGINPLHIGMLSDGICIVIDRSLWVSPEKIWKIRKLLNTKVILIREGDENGLLVALLGKEDMFLGIGVIREIDFRRKVLKIYTSALGKISSIIMGRYKLDENFRENSFFV